MFAVAPVWERGLKYVFIMAEYLAPPGRSRLGAWIEILGSCNSSLGSCVAPVWERGLKSWQHGRVRRCEGRSRLGAWIEIELCSNVCQDHDVAPVWERGLKSVSGIIYPPAVSRSRLGAWIEIHPLWICSARTWSLPFGSVDWNFGNPSKSAHVAVAPVWERGLKSTRNQIPVRCPGRSRLGAWINLSLPGASFLPVSWSV